MKNQLDSKALMKANKKLQYRDMSKGILELIETHNNEELHILCGALGINSKIQETSEIQNVSLKDKDPYSELIYYKKEIMIPHGVKYKREREEMISNIFMKYIHPAENCKDFEKYFMSVLRQIWDGMIMEYLCTVGKNLSKCRKDLRGAVVKYWKRNTVDDSEFTVNSGFEYSPHFLRSNPWVRKLYYDERKETDSSIEENLPPGFTYDKYITNTLEVLNEKENKMKEIETVMRLKPDHVSGRHFLNSITVTRDAEANLRNYLLGNWQKLLYRIDHYYTKMNEANSKLETERTKWESGRLMLSSKNIILSQLLKSLSATNSELRKKLLLENNMNAMILEDIQCSRNKLNNKIIAVTEFKKEIKNLKHSLEISNLNYEDAFVKLHSMDRKNVLLVERINMSLEDNFKTVEDKLCSITNLSREIVVSNIKSEKFSHFYLNSILRSVTQSQQKVSKINGSFKKKQNKLRKKTEKNKVTVTKKPKRSGTEKTKGKSGRKTKSNNKSSKRNTKKKSN